MKMVDLNSLHRESQKKEYVNLNPLQRGGILTSEARALVDEWVDGYSICDHCEGCLDRIKNPPIEDFIHKELPEFLGTEVARVTNGARESKFLVMHSLCEKGDSIVIDGNAHYTTYVAAERAGLQTFAVENSGSLEFRINEEDYAAKIQEVKEKTGKNPELVLLTYPDGNYGNFPDAKKVSKISHDYGVPFLLNCAYSLGRMHLKASDFDVDFIVGSGHKSMAASGPVGVLGARKEWEEKLFRKSAKYKVKEVELLGCTSRGLPVITLMASFPAVLERVKKWGEEVEKAGWFVSELEKIGLKKLGVKPVKHDLNFMESETFYNISQKHKKGRFFLYSELKERGIVGIKPGLTKNFKLSTYQLTKEELEKVLDAFKEISSLPF